MTEGRVFQHWAGCWVSVRSGAFRDPLRWANSVSLPASIAYHPATIQAISRDSAHSPHIQQVRRDAALCKEALWPHKTKHHIEKTRDQNGSRKIIIHMCHCVFIYESFMQNTYSKNWLRNNVRTVLHSIQCKLIFGYTQVQILNYTFYLTDRLTKYF